MSIDFQKVADAIENSPQNIKDIMFSTETSYDIDLILKQYNFTEDDYFKIVDEVGYVILDLKSRFSFNDSLVGIGIEKNIADAIVKDIETEVFSKLDKISQKPDVSNKEQKKREVNDQKDTRNAVGKSFEEAILNQAKGMMPARHASQGDTGGPAREVDTERDAIKKENVPDNLPIQSRGDTNNTPPIPTPNYSGQDPYREPVE